MRAVATKEQIVAEIRRLAAEHGAPPGQKTFAEATRTVAQHPTLAFRFVHAGLFTEGLSPSDGCPCWAHKQKSPASLRDLSVSWWRRGGSNPRPLECDGCEAPALMPFRGLLEPDRLVNASLAGPTVPGPYLQWPPKMARDETTTVGSSTYLEAPSVHVPERRGHHARWRTSTSESRCHTVSVASPVHMNRSRRRCLVKWPSGS